MFCSAEVRSSVRNSLDISGEEVSIPHRTTLPWSTSHILHERTSDGTVLEVSTVADRPTSTPHLYGCRGRGKALAQERLVAETSCRHIGSVEA